jgi:Flp pilus assembly protein TadG
LITRRIFAFLLLDRGSSLVELALVTPLLLSILLGAVDIGRWYFMSIEVAGAADAGALYGTRNYTDAAGIQAVVLADAPDATNLVAGTSSSASCNSAPSCSSNNLVYWVNVTATATFSPVIRWPGVLSTITIQNTARMRIGGS